MQRTILFSLLFASAFNLRAHLAPGTDAPLYRHMLEVNREWRTMDPALAADDHPVHFTSEAERIATHLFLVQDFLLTHADAALTADAAARRGALLAELRAYAGRGVFPINDVVAHRNPVFIDRIGTACAVGHLLITSGHGDIAQAIHDADNLVYVHAIHRADLDAWALENGFTENELAWIQPGYPPTIPWATLAGGTDAPVSVLVQRDDDVIVAGAFTQAGGTAVQHVARFDGSALSALGGGVSGTVVCGTAFNGDVYLGGHALSGSNDLAHWNGTQWSFDNVLSGKSPQMTALGVHDGDLYAAGATLGFAGTDHRVMRLHNGAWEQVGGLFNAPVLALASHDGRLVAAGEFTGLDNGTDALGHVAVLEGGEWLPLGDGLDATVRTLLDRDGVLYAGGDLFENAVPRFGLARLAATADTWELLLPTHDLYMSGNEPLYIGTLASSGTDLYFGGSFGLFTGMTVGAQVGRFLGTPDAVEPIASFFEPVNALALLDDRLIAGGAFQNGSYLAATDLTTGIADPRAERIGIEVLPNPASELAVVTLDRDVASGAVLDVLDVSGRHVMAPLALRDRRTAMDVSGLADGTYVLRVRGADLYATRRFVKH